MPEADLATPPSAGEIFFGPSAVCLPAQFGAWGCRHLPAAESSLTSGWRWLHSDKRLLWFLQCINTIQLLLVGGKLQTLMVDSHLGYWLPDSQAAVCSVLALLCLMWWLDDVGSPQGSVPSPFLFTLSGPTCRSSLMTLQWSAISVVDKAIFPAQCNNSI